MIISSSSNILFSGMNEKEKAEDTAKAKNTGRFSFRRRDRVMVMSEGGIFE